ncbi:MAG: branched-chain amino acid ABC transporter substrate-binding protein [Acidobacteriota bacterium]|nr:branched-chain amino acid ABC transporter substrate-binding protein [Acidobacteriota bacterium]
MLLLPVLGGCGGVAVSAGTVVPGRALTIYSSLPLGGAQATIGRQIERGEKLALSQAAGRVGRWRVNLSLYNDAGPVSGQWEPGLAATNAKLAAQDNDAIAFIGDLDSGATAVSLPIVNGANILQVSPASPYVGLTSSVDAGQDDPQRFYPSGRVTFGRIAPGDPVEAATQAMLLRERHVHTLYVISSEDPLHSSLAALVAGDAEAAGITVAAQDKVNLAPVAEPAELAGEAAKVLASGAQGVFFCGAAERGVASLWRELYAKDPALKLFGCHNLTEALFTSAIGPAARNTWLTSPWLAPSLYPPGAAGVLLDYQARFHEAAEPYALYGYEAMSVVLGAIRAAGKHGNRRQSVIDRFFATRNRDSIIGRYSIQANGETTLTRYGVDRVIGGRAVFVRSYAPAVRLPESQAPAAGG